MVVGIHGYGMSVNIGGYIQETLIRPSIYYCKICELALRRNVAAAPFLFPSRLSSTGHIRTFKTVWAKVARECKLSVDDLGALISVYQWSIVFRRRPVP